MNSNSLFDQNKQDWITDRMWRHANFTVVMVTLMDCFLVIANILADFDVIDGKIPGSEKINT